MENFKQSFNVKEHSGSTRYIDIWSCCWTARTQSKTWKSKFEDYQNKTGSEVKLHLRTEKSHTYNILIYKLCVLNCIVWLWNNHTGPLNAVHQYRGSGSGSLTTELGRLCCPVCRSLSPSTRSCGIGWWTWTPWWRTATSWWCRRSRGIICSR